MAPALHAARTRLTYPLYGADFDPSNQDLLLVGGGGGSKPTGVPNKLTLLECSRVDELKEIVDIELSRTEDAVSSLAVAQSSDSSLTAYAGINSSDADQANGRNEHLRSFRIDLPRKRKAGEGAAQAREPDAPQPQTAPLGRAQFFKVQPGKDQVYQRIVRLSPPSQDASRPRITAIASGLAAESEIVLLKAGSAPGHGNEIARLQLGNKEAVDVDFAPSSGHAEEDAGAQYTMAYCTEHDVRLYRLAGGKKEGVTTQMNIIYSTPEPVGNGRKPSFKALRFLSPEHILLLQNLPGGQGVELLILRRRQDGTSAVISLQKRLGRAMKKATGLDVCLLSESPLGERQILVAVVGTQHIEILRTEFATRTGVGPFLPYAVLQNVHAAPITSIVFSTFLPPTASALPTPTPRPCVKLASVSVDHDVVVHTLALRAFPSARAPSPRYVVVPPGNAHLASTLPGVLMAVLVVGVAAALLQIFAEARGAVPSRLGAREWLPANVREMIGRPRGVAEQEGLAGKASALGDLLGGNEFYAAMLSDASAAATRLPVRVGGVAGALTDLLAEQASAVAGGAEQKAVVVRDVGGDLETGLHHDPVGGEGPTETETETENLRKWEDLKESERVGWRRRLSEAGHWTADQGEGVLKGVLFSELGAIAAQALG